VSSEHDQQPNCRDNETEDHGLRPARGALERGGQGDVITAILGVSDRSQAFYKMVLKLGGRES
jgi:hypothetical protein